MKQTFNFELPTGQKVSVDYLPKFSYFPELNHRVDHFELHGEAISESGYRSEFRFVDTNYNPTKDELELFIKSFIEELSGIKFSQTVQRDLFA